MNNGVIARRYARAFFASLEEKGCTDAVYEQVRVILSALGRVPLFRSALLERSALAVGQKIELLRSAVLPSEMERSIEDLFTLMAANGREELFRLALLDFLEEYRTERKLVMVQITTASANDRIEATLREMMHSDTGFEPVFNHRIDPDIVGGFICESWGYRLDSSVRRALSDLEKELTSKNLF